MKISSQYLLKFNNMQICKNATIYPQKQKYKQIDNLNALYNPAFCGFFKKTQKPQDLRFEFIQKYLEPQKEYLVSPNQKITIGDCTIDFTAQNFKNVLNSYPIGQPFIIGREHELSQYLSNFVSRKHLEVKRIKGGDLIIKDLNSTCGTMVSPSDPYDISNSNLMNAIAPSALQPNVATRIPSDCQLILGDDYVFDMRDKNITNLIEQNGRIIIGRNLNADFVVNDFHGYVSNYHLSLEKDEYGYIATDLNSTNGTYMVPKKNIKPFYFGTKDLEFGQNNVGDCYLLASLYGLSRSNKGSDYLNNMVKVLNDGSYCVKFKNSNSIIVSPDELDGQLSYDGIRRKNSVSGELGLRAIERAYGKEIKFREAQKRPEMYYNQTMFVGIDDGGLMSEALEIITGSKTNIRYISPNNVADILTKYSNNNYDQNILTCSTHQTGRYGDYMDADCKFVKKHAYIIKDIDRFRKQITIVNPHNTRTSYVISWDEFAQMFDRLFDTKLD